MGKEDEVRFEPNLMDKIVLHASQHWKVWEAKIY